MYPYRFTKAQEQLIYDVAIIRKEVTYNGNSSMKDALKRMEIKQSAMIANIEELRFGQQNTLDILDIASWRTNKDGNVVFVSSSLCEMIGCIPSDMMHKGWVGRLIPKDRKRVIDEWELSRMTVSKFNTTATYIRSDGLHIKCKVEGHHYTNSEGELINSDGRFFQIGEPFKPMKN